MRRVVINQEAWTCHPPKIKVMKSALVLLLLVSFAGLASAQLAPNAPEDKPWSVKTGGAAEFDRAIAPYVAKALATYPEAKKRFLAGLPPKHTFFLTTRLRDADGRWEQSFIAVESISQGVVTGIIASDLNGVKGYKAGDRHTFPEDEMLDWLISRPDGTEEGNVVGIFLDTYQGISHPEKTVRDLLQDPEFKLYTVVFGITVDADSKLQGFKVVKVADAKSKVVKAVEVEIPQDYIDAARKVAEARRYKPELKDGKPVEFYTYFFHTAKHPTIEITDMDQPVDKQP